MTGAVRQLWVRQNVASLDSPFDKPLQLMVEALKVACQFVPST